MASVLVLGFIPAALEVTRSLGRSGHRIIVGASSPACYANLSRHCAETWHHPPILDSVSSFFDALAEFLRARPDITVIFPTEDLFLVRLCENRHRLPNHVRIVMPDCGLVRLSDDKLAIHVLIDELGVPQAPYAVARGKAELFEKCDALGYPCVLLHVDSRDAILGKKAMIVDSRKQLDEVFGHRPDFDGRLLLRAFATGQRYNYYLVASEGRILDGIQLKVTRTDKLDDTGTIVECISTAPVPEITRYTERLLSHLNYTGPGMTQFIVDEERGAIAFLEINPRLGASCSVARHAGVDLVRMAFDLACGTPPTEADHRPGYRVGMRFAWFGGDNNGLRRDWRRGEIGIAQAVVWFGRSIGTAVRADAHICWRWSDPLPALGCIFWEFLFAIRKRMIRAEAA
jgi:carbamoylphosphate synthase large subunit